MVIVFTVVISNEILDTENETIMIVFQNLILLYFAVMNLMPIFYSFLFIPLGA